MNILKKVYIRIVMNLIYKYKNLDEILLSDLLIKTRINFYIYRYL